MRHHDKGKDKRVEVINDPHSPPKTTAGYGVSILLLTSTWLMSIAGDDINAKATAVCFPFMARTSGVLLRSCREQQHVG